MRRRGRCSRRRRQRAAQLDEREQALRQRERELAEQRRVLAEEYRLLRSAADGACRGVCAGAGTRPTAAPQAARFTPLRHETAWGRIKRLMLGITRSALEEN